MRGMMKGVFAVVILAEVLFALCFEQGAAVGALGGSILGKVGYETSPAALEEGSSMSKSMSSSKSSSSKYSQLETFGATILREASSSVTSSNDAWLLRALARPLWVRLMPPTVFVTRGLNMAAPFTE